MIKFSHLHTTHSTRHLYINWTFTNSTSHQHFTNSMSHLRESLSHLHITHSTRRLHINSTFTNSTSHQHITNSMSHLRESLSHLHMYTTENALCVAPRANIVSPFTFTHGTTYWIRDRKVVRHTHVCILNSKQTYVYSETLTNLHVETQDS